MPRQNAKTLMIHARIDPKLKKAAESVFSEIGISTTEAIRLFLKQVELHNGLPFPVSIPNEETIAAVAEANAPGKLKRYRSFRELRDHSDAARASNNNRLRQGRPPCEKVGRLSGDWSGHWECHLGPDLVACLPDIPDRTDSRADRQP